jgi:predicted NUDIX family NTP pyrophosphohydrolase
MATAIRPTANIDRAAWFGIAKARLRILKGQAIFIDRLLEALGQPEGS